MTPEAIPYIFTKTEIDAAVEAWQKGESKLFYDLIRRVVKEVKELAP